MVPADEALEARPNARVTIILAQLDSLVHLTVPVAEVRALWVAEVDTEAFR